MCMLRRERGVKRQAYRLGVISEEVDGGDMDHVRDPLRFYRVS